MSDAKDRLAEALSDRYTLGNEIGVGGMATVYMAEDIKHGRTVALKVLKPELSSAMGTDRFPREIRLIASFNHPHILSLYDSGESAGFLYYVMPFVEGETLGARLAREKELPIGDVIRILIEVTDALAYAHDRGVVHRDIKPPNIMLVGRNRAKIMDFGIARMRSSELKTQTGMMMGTPRYMSPEQVAGRPVDNRSDIFSLGTVLYELLTGTKLFAGGDATEIMYNVSQLRPVPPSRINRQVSPMLDLMVAKALEKDADERYQDAHQFADDLRACLAELGGQRPDPDVTARLERTIPEGGAGDDAATRTLRLGAEGDDAPDAGTRNRGAKAQAIIVDSNTRLGLSRVFDSAAALKRLAQPEKKDHARLVRAPRPLGTLARLARDADLAWLLLFILAAIAVGGFLVLR